MPGPKSHFSMEISCWWKRKEITLENIAEKLNIRHAIQMSESRETIWVNIGERNITLSHWYATKEN